MSRRSELIRRSQIDTLRFDKRPLSVIMNDEIPYQRWERAAMVRKRAGRRNWYG